MNIPSRFLKYSNRAVDELKEIILSKRSRGGEYNQKSIAAKIAWNESLLSTWLKGGEAKLNEIHYYRLLNEIALLQWIPPEDYDSVFAGISSFLGDTPTFMRERYSQFEGHYVIYRYSLLAREQVLQCALQIKYNEKKNALETREDSRIPADVLFGSGMTTDDSPESLSDKLEMEDLEFPREGHFFRQSADCYLLVSKKINKHPAEVETIYFNNIHGVGNGDDIQPRMMWGYFSDWHSRRFYVGKVCARRLNSKLDANQITVLDPSSLPRDIRHGLLSGMPDKKLGVFEFNAPRD